MAFLVGVGSIKESHTLLEDCQVEVSRDLFDTVVMLLGYKVWLLSAARERKGHM
jgi:hypothetical protein